MQGLDKLKYKRFMVCLENLFLAAKDVVQDWACELDEFNYYEGIIQAWNLDEESEMIVHVRELDVAIRELETLLAKI